MQGKSQSILLGALVAALLGIILSYVAQLNQYLGLFVCCIPGIVAGLIAVWHYTDAEQVTLRAGQGAQLGAISAAIGSIISSLVVLLLQQVGLMRGTEEQLEIQRQQMMEQGMDPAQIDQALGFAESMTSPPAMAGFMLVGILVAALIGAIGGAIGANLFKKGTDDAVVTE